MASGKSSSVTLQSLLPDRAYKVTVSAVHYMGESESTSATGRTGEWTHQLMYLHCLSSTRPKETSTGAVMSLLALGCGWGHGFAQQGGLLTWKRENPPPISAIYLQFKDEQEGLVAMQILSQVSRFWTTELTYTLLSLSAPVMSKLPSIRGFIPSKTEGKSPIKAGFGILFIYFFPCNTSHSMGPSGQAGAGVALLDRHPWGLQISPRRGWNHLTLKAGSPSKETGGGI